MITPASRAWLRWHGHYRKQLLPHAGGVGEQPAAYLDAMEIIEAEFNRVQFERMRKSKPA